MNILSIIIVNYNSEKVLTDCLQSLYSEVIDIPFEVFVIDNASIEKVTKIAACFPDTNFIYNQVNLGFAAANNIGIKRAKGEFILLLNPDTIVNSHSFLPMVKYLEDHNDVGVVGCKIFNLEGEIERSTHSFPTLAKEFVHANEFIKQLLNYNSPIGNFLRKLTKSKSFESYWDHNSIREVDHVTGACMMVKREAIKKAGMLDEAFFLYNEEVEWSLRIKKAGYKSVFLPDSSIIHLFGHSTKQKVQKQTPNWLLVERYRGMLYFFQKHYSGKLFLFRLIILQGFTLRLIGYYLKLYIFQRHERAEHKKTITNIKSIIKLSFQRQFDWRIQAK
jgi:GT2 family glycosyltransferase